MDRKLPLHQRLGIRMHLLMCKYCYRYRSQLFFLRNVIQKTAEWNEAQGAETPMPDAARERINASLQRYLAG